MLDVAVGPRPSISSRTRDDLAIPIRDSNATAGRGWQETWSRNWSPTPANSAELLGRDWLYQARFGLLDAFRLNF